jgi:hypothetical protein
MVDQMQHSFDSEVHWHLLYIACSFGGSSRKLWIFASSSSAAFVGNHRRPWRPRAEEMEDWEPDLCVLRRVLLSALSIRLAIGEKVQLGSYPAVGCVLRDPLSTW